MNKIAALIVVIFFCSCNTGIEFVIHNDSSNRIDFVNISTSDKKANLTIKNVEANSEKIDFLNMNKVGQVDGSYFLEINQDKNYKIVNFGYYTNGSPVEEKFDIYISNDTVIFKETLKNY